MSPLRLLLHVILYIASCNCEVLELSDRFLDVMSRGSWFVEFYAPWCGHCKKLELLWEQVGSSEALSKLAIRVGKMDATRFTQAAKELEVRGFPTIHFYKEGKKYNYHGERTVTDMVEFALMSSGPAMRQITSAQQLENLRREKEVFFTYVSEGEEVKDDEELYVAYKQVAENSISLAYFYLLPSEYTTPSPETSFPVIRVYKHQRLEDFIVPPPAADVDGEGERPVNVSLQAWVREERFPVFSKVGAHSLHAMSHTNKLILLAVVETIDGMFSSKLHHQFKVMVGHLAEQHYSDFHDKYHFAWTDSVDTIYSLATSFIPLPNVIVFKPDSYHYYSMDESPAGIQSEAILAFLRQVSEGKVPQRGGNAIGMRIYRVFWDIFSFLVMMFYNQPLISTLLVGLPISMLVFICCNICCSEPYDDDDDHEKKE